MNENLEKLGIHAMGMSLHWIILLGIVFISFILYIYITQTSKEKHHFLTIPIFRFFFPKPPLPKHPKAKHCLNEETLHSLLEKLEKFEKSEKYLKKELNVIWMANFLQTNTKYVSEIIRIHSGKKFNHYINGLRIQYITQKLQEEPQFREYKISYLAEKSGFSSSQVFTIAFKKENQITPSQFIESLKNRTD